MMADPSLRDNTAETCSHCWERVDAVHAETRLCPKCTRAERRWRALRRREPHPSIPELPGQIDIFEVLAEIDATGGHR